MDDRDPKSGLSRFLPLEIDPFRSSDIRLRFVTKLRFGNGFKRFNRECRSIQSCECHVFSGCVHLDHATPARSAF